MAENILTVENLNIAYQGVPAVMDVNFTLERGKVLTIVGAVSYTHLDVYKRQDYAYQQELGLVDE